MAAPVSEVKARLHDQLVALPTKPGIYQMLAADAQVLYVGKARNLRNRVGSYFRTSGLSSKTLALVSRIHAIEVTITASETEALLLEQSLIKALRPPYNVLFRDDKSYPYIRISSHPEYPQLSFFRGAKQSGSRYFGPYPSSSAVRESLHILQRIFRLRPCEDSYFSNRSRPCLQYQIGRCSAPCVGLISVADYAEDLRRAELFLQGKSLAVLEEFKIAMEQAAEAMQYERAAQLRDQIAQLRAIQEQQYVHTESGSADVLAIEAAGGLFCVQVLFVRGGRMLGQRTWFPKDPLVQTGQKVMADFIAQFYLGGVERDLPDQIIAGFALPEHALLASAIQQRFHGKVQLVGAVRGAKARWVRMAQDNARLNLSAKIADGQQMHERFNALGAGLELNTQLRRMECFDISHTSGEATVASCVVFDNNGPLKSDYRRFNIEGINPGDDYAAMAQALQRRYRRLQTEAGLLPDLLIIDGGIGQLREAQKILLDLQIQGVQLLGIAKGPSRKPGMERFYLLEVMAGAEPQELALAPQGGATLLLQQIRDEAHRFAVTGHRQRRQRARQVSALDEIPGVGPARKRELLRHFGSLSVLQGASAEEIAKLPGISARLAARIYARLHPE